MARPSVAGWVTALALVSAARALAWEYVDPMGAYDAPAFIGVDVAGDVVVNDGRARVLDGLHGNARWTADADFGDAAMTSYGAVAGAYEDGGCLGARLLDSAEGSPVWSFVDATACSIFPQAAAVDTGDNVVVGGLGLSPLPNSRRIHVTKVNGASGMLVWRTDWGIGSGSGLLDLVTDASDDVLALEYGGTVVKLDGSDGSEVWRTSLGFLIGYSAIAVAPSGDVYVTGRDANETFTVARLLGSTGAIAATRVVPGRSRLSNAVAVGPGVVVAADVDNLFTVVRLDPLTLVPSWQAGFSGTAPLTGDADPSPVGAIAFDGAGDVVATGAALNQKTRRDLLVLKLDGVSGSLLWRREFAGTAGAGRTGVNDFGRGIAVDAGGDVVVTGYIENDDGDGSDVAHVTLKLRTGDGGSSGGLFAGITCNLTLCGPCEVCVAPDTCAVGPRTDCELPVDPTGSKVLLGDDPVTGRDRVTWRWRHGAGIVDAALGDPRLTTDYAMCVFDDVGGTPQLRWSREVPALGSCAKRPCWKESPKPGPLYFIYVDRTTAPAGKTTFKMKLRGGDAAHAQLLAKGKGPGVAMPALGLADPVRVELRSSLGGCWAANYGAGIQTNTPAAFAAKGGP